MAMIEIKAADGHEFGCWIEPAKGVRKGGIVMLQEIFGVTDQLKRLARRYSALGYEVAIPALFDRQQKGVVVSFDDIDRAVALMQGTDRAQTLLDIEAAVQVLAAKGGKVGVIGFCWGGGLALGAAQQLDIAASVAFYGTRLDSYLDRPLKAPMQGHFGANDSHTPPEQLEQVQAYLGEGFEYFTYEAGHAFANDQRPSYVAEAAELAHDRAAAFFAKHLE